jgi:hypothetical protein
VPVCLVPVPFWVAACRRDADFSALPAALALTAVAMAVTAVIMIRRTVTLTPGALVSRSWNTTSVFAWPDISRITVNRTDVWIVTQAGSFVLPLPASTPSRHPLDGDGATAALGDEMRSWWLRCRGDDWVAAPFTAWRPGVDVKGRVVFRGSLLAGLARCSCLLWLALIESVIQPLSPSTTFARAATNSISFAAAVIVAIALYQCWARVTVDPDNVEVRSLRGSERIPRAAVIDIREKVDSWPGAFGRKPVRLAVFTGGRTIALPAPQNRLRWFGHDPEYYRKWLWLDEELVVRHAEAPNRGVPNS